MKRINAARTLTAKRAAAVGAAVVALLMMRPLGASAADQSAETSNTGVAGAMTGENDASGNGSTNNAATSLSSGGPGATQADNGSAVANDSKGRGHVTSGDGNAVGNTSSNDGAQSWKSDAFGSQRARVTNNGFGFADTGGNSAIGNDSDNDASVVENAGGATTGASDTQSANGASDLDVGIGGNGTGSNGVTGGAGNGGNGAGTASGLPGAPAAGAPGDVTLAAAQVQLSNRSRRRNLSDGTAEIITGDANAIGNVSVTHLDQVVGDADAILVDQDLEVENFGASVAISGGNVAAGNTSRSRIRVAQDAFVGLTGGTGTGIGTGGDALGFGVGGDGTGGNGTQAGIGLPSISGGPGTPGTPATPVVGGNGGAVVGGPGAGGTPGSDGLLPGSNGGTGGPGGPSSGTGGNGGNAGGTAGGTGGAGGARTGGNGSGTGTGGTGTGGTGTGSGTGGSGTGIGQGADATLSAEDIIVTNSSERAQRVRWHRDHPYRFGYGQGQRRDHRPVANHRHRRRSHDFGPDRFGLELRSGRGGQRRQHGGREQLAEHLGGDASGGGRSHRWRWHRCWFRWCGHRHRARRRR